MNTKQFISALTLFVSIFGVFHAGPVSASETQALDWALAFENDLLAGDERDKDYTYGVNLAFTGLDVDQLRFQPSRLQAELDKQLKRVLPDNNSLSINRKTVEYGLYGFTPDDIELTSVQSNDRPYASLLYAQSTSETIDILNNVTWAQSLSIGILGLDFVGSLQNNFHSATGSNDAKGWHNQISDGGELTAKYSIARQKIWVPSRHWEFKSTTQVSLGYLTEASVGLSLRAGNIRSAWWGFKPELVSYGERSNFASNTNWVEESFFWAGFNIKARAYNSFLQGQVRDSDHTYNHSELNHYLAEAWLGYTIGFKSGYRVSYGLRGHTSEIKEGKGDRNIVWGSLVVSKSL